jgi:hypothetical protein
LFADLGRLQLVGVLVAAQLCLFVGMEVWERLAIASICCEQVHVGAFGAGFVAELLVAVGSAIAIAVFGAATARVVQLLRIRAPERAARLKELPAHREFVRLPRVLAGTGGVRAPPSLAHSRGEGVRCSTHPRSPSRRSGLPTTMRGTCDIVRPFRPHGRGQGVIMGASKHAEPLRTRDDRRFNHPSTGTCVRGCSSFAVPLRMW